MVAPARPVRFWWLPAGLYTLPLAAALAGALGAGLDAAAWQRLRDDPALVPSLRLSLWVGGASTLLALGASLLLVTHLHGTTAWRRVERTLGALLAVPHAAFAVGLALLLMPSGALMRLAAPLAGWDTPPDLATLQDPAGLALIAGLVLKEVPFLLWNLMAQLRPPAQARLLHQQLLTARTLGYADASAWWRVLWPQLLPRLALPLLAVWAYGVTVVDMALVLGPTRPPTLAVLAWQWLLDAEAAVNAQGAAAALLLALVTAGGALFAAAALRLARPPLHRWRARGDRPAPSPLAALMPGCAGAGGVLYALVLAMLAFVSVAGVWTFPAWWPQQLTAEAWSNVAAARATLALSAGLGLLSALTGLALAVAWMEGTAARWDAAAAPVVFATLLVPGLLMAVGLYRLALALHLDGQLAGLWLAHSLYTAPYALIALAPAYRGFDTRYAQIAAALGHGRAVFLWRVKWPMLRAPIAAALAVGFAVSIAQYLSTQFVGAGRHATVTTEAITLAAGGQRPTMAAFALLQALLPALAFALAWAVGRHERRRAPQEP